MENWRKRYLQHPFFVLLLQQLFLRRQDKKDDGKAGTVECFQYGSSRPKKARMFFRSQGQRLRDADGEKRFQFWPNNLFLYHDNTPVHDTLINSFGTSALFARFNTSWLLSLPKNEDDSLFLTFKNILPEHRRTFWRANFWNVLEVAFTYRRCRIDPTLRIIQPIVHFSRYIAAESY